MNASEVTPGPGARREDAAEVIGRSSMSSASMSWVGRSVYSFVFEARRNGPWGRMTKKARSMKQGRKADDSRDVLTLNPIVVVRSTYRPAPTNPAPPVPLPHAAREKGP